MTFDELYKYYLQQGFTKPISGVAPSEGIQTLMPTPVIPTTGGGGGGSDAPSSPSVSSTGTTKGIGSLGKTIFGAIVSAINPAIGFALSMTDPNSMARQVLGSISNNLGLGYGNVDMGSVTADDYGGFDGPATADDYGGFDGTESAGNAGFGSTGTGVGTDTGDDGSGGVGSASDSGAASSASEGSFATGGRVGYNEGTEPTNQLKYIEPNINYTTGSQGPVKTEIFEGIIRGNLPLDDKWKILGDLGIIDNRMKFKDFVNKFKDIQRTLGIGYDSGDGLSGFLKYNFDTKEPQAGIQYKKTFQSGGRVNYLQGGLSSLLGSYYGKR